MANIKPIRTEVDYGTALAHIDELMDAEPGSAEGDEIDVLVDLVELYESKHVKMGPCTNTSPVNTASHNPDWIREYQDYADTTEDEK